MTEFPQSGKSRRRRFAPLAVVAGVGATAALALSMTGTLSAFTATITNSQNTVSTGTVVMAETGLNSTGSSVTCTSNDGTSGAGANGNNAGNNIAANSSQCAVINKYGYNTTLVPGSTSSATVSFKNTGTAAAGTFALAAQGCTQTGQVTTGTVVSALDLCSKIGIVITHTVGGNTTTITPANSTLTSINATPPAAFSALGGVAANSAQTDSFTFTLTVPAGLGNTYQGLTVSQPLVWTYTAGS